MVKQFFHFLFRLKKWHLKTPPPDEAHNCIMIAAPHTSNWDFVYTMSALDKLELNPRFTIKKEFNRFPLGGMIRNMGAIWIDRSPKQAGEERLSMVQVMADLFRKSKEPLCVVVTVEGTRSKTTKWKTGFYYAAVEAKVPICLAYMDYEKRTCGVDHCFMPSGNIVKDMKHIMDFYQNIKGKHPENFALDERYS